MDIRIDQLIKKQCEDISFGILISDVKVSNSSDAFLKILESEVENIKSNNTMSDYATEQLKSARSLYRNLKKDPTRYRISADSLLRRVIKDKGMYYVNNIVDINNMFSLKTQLSIGAYDLNKIDGDIIYTLGTKEEKYEGIGRGTLNIENLPVLKDNISAFGSGMSDSIRTMVNDKTTRVLMVVHSHIKDDKFHEILDELEKYIVEYAEGTNIKSYII